MKVKFKHNQKVVYENKPGYSNDATNKPIEGHTYKVKNPDFPDPDKRRVWVSVYELPGTIIDQELLRPVDEQFGKETCERIEKEAPVYAEACIELLSKIGAE